MRNRPFEEGRRWYQQAREDFKWDRNIFGQNGGYHIICFLCQQIGEKGLKAYLYARGEELVLGHSIVKLSEKAALLEGAFKEKCGNWSVLDTYYITARYPNGIPNGIPAETFNRTMAEGALALADDVLTFVNGLISFE